MVNDKMKAEDIVQEVFIKLFKNFSQINNHESILFWLYSTAKNEIYTYFRSKTNKNIYLHSSDPEEIDVCSDTSVIEDYEKTEMNSIIHRELEEMNYEYKEIFILREYSGLSYKEISALLQIEEGLVKSRLYKTRQKLINRISKLFKQD